ncbi:MAG: hypothetical protein KDA24_23360 [Deltaproteobacteria bacterium]|nr:hypothetical protein [Deltaproteobacteria bacterium]
MRLSSTLLLLLLVPLAGCDLCWPRGGGMETCLAPDDDDSSDDDDVANDDDSGDDDDTGDDDDATPDCLTPGPRPKSFLATDTFGYGYTNSDATDIDFCWFTQDDGIEVETNNLSSAGASVSHSRIEWDIQWYGQTAEVMRIDVNGVIHFDYHLSVNPNNFCSEPQSDLPVVAVYWDNLDMLGDGAGSIWHGVMGEAPNRIAVAWWENMHRVSDGNRIDIQFHLHEDGHAEVHYRLVEGDIWESDLGRGATVGVLVDSEESANPGLWVGCNDPVLKNDFSIAYWPPE